MFHLTAPLSNSFKIHNSITHSFHQPSQFQTILFCRCNQLNKFNITWTKKLSWKHCQTLQPALYLSIQQDVLSNTSVCTRHIAFTLKTYILFGIGEWFLVWYISHRMQTIFQIKQKPLFFSKGSTKLLYTYSCAMWGKFLNAKAYSRYILSCTRSRNTHLNV